VNPAASDAEADGSADSPPTPADALPDREETTPLRAGLVGAWAAAALIATRD